VITRLCTGFGFGVMGDLHHLKCVAKEGPRLSGEGPSDHGL
jgi:hypothetical protein